MFIGNIMKNILVVAPYCSLPGEPNFNRFLYLSQLLANYYNVTLVTSRFVHFNKTHRNTVKSLNPKIVLIDEPGYKNNVSIKRVISHKFFTVNFKKWIEDSFDYDLVYSAYPLIETNIIIANLKEQYNFKFLIDVQDIWPESISPAFPLLKYMPTRLMPFTKKANKAYSAADALIAVSDTYLKRAKSYNQTDLLETVYIGSDFNIIKNSTPMKLNNNFKLVYIGTLSYSYDVETIINAVIKLNMQGYNIEFHIFGSGPFEESLNKKATSSLIFFHGFVDISYVFSFLKSSNVAVNCLSSSSKQTITNKLSDFMSIGVPILNSQTNPEVLELLKTVDHENYLAGNVDSATKSIVKLYNRKTKLSFKPNDSFNRDIEYQKILHLISKLIG